MARVHLTDDAREDIRGLDGAARRIVLAGLKKLEDCPEQRGAPLGNRPDSSLAGLRKLVVGNRDYRIVYRAMSDGTVVVVFVIAKRADSEVYNLAAARLAALDAEQLRALAERLRGRVEGQED